MYERSTKKQLNNVLSEYGRLFLSSLKQNLTQMKCKTLIQVFELKHIKKVKLRFPKSTLHFDLSRFN